MPGTGWSGDGSKEAADDEYNAKQEQRNANDGSNARQTD